MDTAGSSSGFEALHCGHHDRCSKQQQKNSWDSVARKLGVPLHYGGSYGYEWSALLANAIAEQALERSHSIGDRDFRTGCCAIRLFEPDDPPDFQTILDYQKKII